MVFIECEKMGKLGKFFYLRKIHHVIYSFSSLISIQNSRNILNKTGSLSTFPIIKRLLYDLNLYQIRQYLSIFSLTIFMLSFPHSSLKF